MGPPGEAENIRGTRTARPAQASLGGPVEAHRGLLRMPPWMRRWGKDIWGMKDLIEAGHLGRKDLIG